MREARTLALCQEIADRVPAVALDEDEDLTSAEGRALVEIALKVERQAKDEET